MAGQRIKKGFADKALQAGAAFTMQVVSLPTGGGKTRVTVQAAVDLILKPEGCARTVLWVAQTDELCEQAVQSFRQVWINRGAQRTPLRIVRLWGGNRTPAPSVRGQPITVIASIQTLNSRVGKEELAWLEERTVAGADFLWLVLQHVLPRAFGGRAITAFCIRTASA